MAILPEPLTRRDGTSIHDRQPRWFDRGTVVAADEESKPGRLDRTLLRRLVELVWPYRWSYAAATVLVVIGASVEQFDKLFIGRIIDDVMLATGQIAEHQPNWLNTLTEPLLGTAAPMTRIAVWGLLWAGVFAIGIGIHRYVIYWQARVGEQIITQLRQRVFRHLQSMSMSYYDRTQLGRVITRGSSDIDMLREVIQNGSLFIAVNTAIMVVSAVMIVLIDWKLFLALFWLAPVLALLNSVYRSQVGAAWQDVRTMFTRMSTALAESISGVRVVAAFDRQESNLDHFNRLQDYNSANNLRAAMINGIYQPALFLLQFVGQLVILVYGGYRIAHGTISAGDVISIFLYWEAYMGPAIAFGNFYNQLMMAMASGQRVFQLLDQQPQVRDAPGANDLPPIRGSVRFESVVFGYDPQRPVLHGVSFDVQPGQTLALVGHTGSGKSSIINLLNRFYEPQQGRILLDGHDISTVRQASLSRQVGLVLQSNFLFNGTVQDNIRYGKPQASDDEVREACRKLDLLDALESLDKGLLTPVGERGSNLSLGQRQMVCLCRAMLEDPRLLMLDEATSAVDIQTEQRLQRAIENLVAGRTTVIVAHRLSTIVSADEILVLDHGRVIERGNHATLLAADGHYAELYRQFARGFRET